MMAVDLKLPDLELLYPTGWQDYALLDSGDGHKLEKFGPYRLVRPEAEAVWQPGLSASEWKSADAVYKPAPEENGGHWEYRRKLPERWKLTYKQLAFWTQTSASRHVGVSLSSPVNGIGRSRSSAPRAASRGCSTFSVTQGWLPYPPQQPGRRLRTSTPRAK